jgi:hypothetical protein
LRNPHAYFTVDAINESGEQVEWTVQMAAPTKLLSNAI